jgi:hypothetical protein
MKISKKGLEPVQRETTLSTSQSSSLGAERDEINGVPYASTIGSIMLSIARERTCHAYEHDK